VLLLTTLLIINKLLMLKGMNMRYLFTLAVAGMLALAGCSSGTVASNTAAVGTVASTVTTDANTILTVAEATLAAYKATSNPNAAVVAEATKLLSAAQTVVNQYGPEASVAVSAAGALATYLLTAAPGNGVTPASIPAS
jgi:hypothetical protein